MTAIFLFLLFSCMMHYEAFLISPFNYVEKLYYYYQEE